MSPTPPTSTRFQRFAWCFYDFANSAFPTVIVTAVYVLYFKGVVVGDSEPGESDRLWGLSNSIAAGVVFLVAPVLGAVADLSGRKRHFLIGFASLCVAATALLSLTGPGTVALAVGAFIAASVGFEGSCVFYNAFLPQLVGPDRMERLSGAGWALGYIGGLGCLLVVLPIAATDGPVGVVPLIVAAWFAVFSIPALVSLEDRGRTERVAGDPGYLIMGVRRLAGTFRQIRRHANLVRFLAAYFFYNNAVLTIIVFAVAFSKDSLQFAMTESIVLIIMMNVVAAPGAYVFGRIAGRVGARRTILTTLVMWLAVVLGAEVAAWMSSAGMVGAAKISFWGVSVLASLCIGAIQANSRAFVGQMAPQGRSSEFYGFMAFAGKGAAVLGPIVFGFASELFDQRVAVGTIGAFFLAGLILMLRVKEPAREPVEDLEVTN